MCQFHGRPASKTAIQSNAWTSELLLGGPQFEKYREVCRSIAEKYDRYSAQCGLFNIGRAQAIFQRTNFVSELHGILSGMVSQRITELTLPIQASQKVDDPIVKQRAIDAINELRTLSEISRKIPHQGTLGEKRRFCLVMQAVDQTWQIVASSAIDSISLQERTLEQLRAHASSSVDVITK